MGRDARPPPASGICRIGTLTLDANTDVLLRDGVPLPLGQRAVGLLRRLVQTPGEIVGKDELYESVWLNFSRFVFANGDPAAALPMAERALAALAAALAPTAPAIRAAVAIVADCLDALGRGTEAADLPHPRGKS